ncbi:MULTISPECIES: hypothetical protein [unclassified Corallococcus]|uniref:hypothetical protein n=1 Tax=unclassified Corallococcus TaxID=2685029 RepID=UPI001A8CD06C|nr:MULTISPECIES: hypothetical protein [unclassified Corallococcus]MBN9685376.1 hypothetical protein [Corallococcus sp. NCSPR001]WAS83173.1 hypothetical protein O0N60_28110 [Corallococcus sp. NCRR]
MSANPQQDSREVAAVRVANAHAQMKAAEEALSRALQELEGITGTGHAPKRLKQMVGTLRSDSAFLALYKDRRWFDLDRIGKASLEAEE